MDWKAEMLFVDQHSADGEEKDMNSAILDKTEQGKGLAEPSK